MLVSHHVESQAGQGRLSTAEPAVDRRQDELLHWLVDDLPRVVRQHWGMCASEWVRCLAEARQDAVDWVNVDAAADLRGLGTGSLEPVQPWLPGLDGQMSFTRLSDVSKRAFILASYREDDVVRAIRDRSYPAELGRATVCAFEVMRPVQLGPNDDGSSRTGSTAYVDLVARVSVPHSAAYVIDGFSCTGRQRSLLRVQSSEAALVAAALAFKPDGVRLELVGREREVWFVVRGGEIGMGQIIRDLKRFRAFEGGQHDVTLVVDRIDPRLKVLIENEGFVVVDRSLATPGEPQ